MTHGDVTTEDPFATRGVPAGAASSDGFAPVSVPRWVDGYGAPFSEGGSRRAPPVWSWVWMGPDPAVRQHRVAFDRRRATHWIATGVAAVLAFLLAMGVVAGLTVILEGLFGSDPSVTTASTAAAGDSGGVDEVAAMGGLTVVLLVLTLPPLLHAGVFHGGWQGLLDRLGLRFHAPLKDLGIGLGIGVAMVPASLLLVGTYYRLFPQPADAAGSGIELVAPTWALVVMTSVVAGVSEEVLFRGWLQPRFGIWTSNVAFALVHINYGTVPQLFVPLLLGIGMGALTVWRRSIWAAIVAHFTFDVVQLSLVKVYVDAGGASSFWGPVLRDVAASAGLVIGF